MAAENGTNEARCRRELHSALQKLVFTPNYPEVTLWTQFNSSLGGRGIKAARAIPRGTPILSERALFSVVPGAQPTPAQERDAGFQALSCPPAPTTLTRFDVNRFQMGKDANERHGIFLQASRFNHSCIPNAHFAWNWKLRRLTVHATIDIPKDEEILLNYLPDDFLKTTLQRQQELRSYNFQCTCPACQPDTAFGMKSQQRRAKMRTLHKRIEKNEDEMERAKRDQLLADIEEFNLLLQQEGLFYPQLADSYAKQVSWYITAKKNANGADCATYEGLLGKALQVAREKLLLDVVCLGHASPEVQKTLKLICDLDQE